MAIKHLLLTLPLFFYLALTSPIHQSAAKEKRQFPGGPGGTGGIPGHPGFPGPPFPPAGFPHPPFSRPPALDSIPLMTSTIPTVTFGTAASSMPLLTSYSSKSEITTTTCWNTTLTRTRTISYTLGSGTSTRVTSIVVAKIVTDTTTIVPISSPSPSSSPISFSSVANVSSSTTFSSIPIISSSTTTKYVPPPSPKTFSGLTSTSRAETASSSVTSQSSCSSASPPAPTQSGVVADCTEWYVTQPGDYCYTVAQQFGLDMNVLMTWNRAVEPPTCARMLAGDAYCVRVCGGSSSTTGAAPTTSVTSMSASATISSASTASPSFPACSATATPPTPTQSATVTGCIQWTVAQPGDTCYGLAQQFGISTNTFMDWNPSVGPPGCLHLLAGDAYCVAVCGATSTSPSASGRMTAITHSSVLTELSLTSTIFNATTSTLTSSALSTSASSNITLTTGTLSSSTLTTSSSTFAASSAPPASPTISPNDKYVSYCGDGSDAAGWPDMSQWLDFDYLFTYNTPSMAASCAQWGVPNDSPSEIAEMRSSILTISNLTSIDARFILAIIMQESTGCVRVITTAYAHANPGLMQSFNGTGSCNANAAPLGIPSVDGSGEVQTPCPASEIYQQILDGTNGTIYGPGLKQNMMNATAVPFSDEAQTYYRTARIYNGGGFMTDDLSQPCCTTSYASDVANRLMGWQHAEREFTCT